MALDEQAERVEVPVRGSRNIFHRPIVSPLGLIAGLLLLAALCPVDQLAVAEPRSSVPKPNVALKVSSPKALLHATPRLQRAVVTNVTTKLDLTAIRPADFGDWE